MAVPGASANSSALPSGGVGGNLAHTASGTKRRSVGMEPFAWRKRPDNGAGFLPWGNACHYPTTNKFIAWCLVFLPTRCLVRPKIDTRDGKILRMGASLGAPDAVDRTNFGALGQVPRIALSLLWRPCVSMLNRRLRPFQFRFGQEARLRGGISRGIGVRFAIFSRGRHLTNQILSTARVWQRAMWTEMEWSISTLMDWTVQTSFTETSATGARRHHRRRGRGLS